MSDENTITITVSGYTASGKSQVSCLLKQFLEAVGFDVELNLSDGDIEDIINERLMDAISNITPLRKIEIKEQNISRAPRSRLTYDDTVV